MEWCVSACTGTGCSGYKCVRVDVCVICVFFVHAVFNMCNVSVQEQYQREQEKLKKEWEKAQLEVEEEERKHNEEVQSHNQTKLTDTRNQKHRCFSNMLWLYSVAYIFQERRILEETVTPLNPTGLLNQQSGQTLTTSSAPENNETKGGNVPLQQNGERISTGNEDQHASKLHFFQGEIHAEIQIDMQEV